MISTFQALAVALIAITPGATYTFAYERHAGAYGAHLSDRLVRFLVASGFFHAFLAGPEIALAYRIHEHGYVSLKAWLAECLAILYIVLPYLAGLALGWATLRDLAGARWIVGSSRYPRAWDHLWSRNRPLIVRLKLRSGDHLAGIFEHSTDEIASYAAGYGEEADLYLSKQLIVDPVTGAFETNENGEPIRYDPPIGLLIRATDVESWHIQEVKNV